MLVIFHHRNKVFLFSYESMNTVVMCVKEMTEKSDEALGLAGSLPIP